jgi:dihydropteroate synthase
VRLEPNVELKQIKNLRQAELILERIGSDRSGAAIMKDKAVFKTFYIENIRTKAANILKQTFLGKGGEAAVSRETAELSKEYTDVLLCGTLKQYKQALAQLRSQPWGLKSLAEKIESLLLAVENPVIREYAWADGKRLSLKPNESLVMGILNVTPDSFSDGGDFFDAGAAVERAIEMQEEGADIIDIGAESTRPYNGGAKISADEEKRRLLPILDKILPHCRVPVSVDSYKAEVMDEALAMGAHIANDIWGLQNDAAMAGVVARHGVPVVAMHNSHDGIYKNGIMQEMLAFLQNSINIGVENGIRQENIIVDPGLGFAKSFADNMEIMANLEELHSLGCPVLLAASRKRFIGEVLSIAEPKGRVMGTAAVTALGQSKGVHMHRVHDVREIKELLKMLDAMTRSGDLWQRF